MAQHVANTELLWVEGLPINAKHVEEPGHGQEPVCDLAQSTCTNEHRHTLNQAVNLA